MTNTQTDSLGLAIERLLDAKLYDLLGRPDGTVRFAAHLATGVVSPQIRLAQCQLDNTIKSTIAGCGGERRSAPKNRRRHKAPANTRGGNRRFRRDDDRFSTDLCPEDRAFSSHE